jgi:hypothetical protein
MHLSDTKPENEMVDPIRQISDQFLIEGTFSAYKPFGNGHIHDTFLIETTEIDKDDYILQKINNKIFKNIPELQSNIERVILHLKKKISATPGSNIKRECLNIVYSKNGKSWINDRYGNFWRMFVFIQDHRSYDIVDSPEKAFQGGRAIGRFQAMLADLDGKPLYETIPDFQDITIRIKAFDNILKINPVNRLDSVWDEVRFLRERANNMQVIMGLVKDGQIPIRITHNDTKFNNILFDLNDIALCLIDLDTVMPSYVHYDFGDALRTAANTASEDEENLSKVKMDINLFRAFSEGYLSETASTLSSTEKDYLALAPIVITYTQAVRFLTDYLAGDTYYKIHHEYHNLQRTRAQIALVKSMEEQYTDMKSIIDKLS